MKRALRFVLVCLGLGGLGLGPVGCNDGKIGGGSQDMTRAGLDGFITTDPIDLSGFDFPPQLGTVYVHTGTMLYVMNPTTYDLVEVGHFHGGADLGNTEDMTDLAVTPDGKIYTISRTSLYTVDENTGLATKILNNTITSSNVGLTFLNNGTLLAADQAGAVRVIDPATGDVTEMGTHGTGYDEAGDLVSIADGTMYGISTKAPSLGSTENVLIKVNTTTAKATTVGQIGYTGVFGVAYTGGKVIAFTKDGEIIRIDPTTGAGTLVKTHAGMKFYGAGTSPLVPVL